MKIGCDIVDLRRLKLDHLPFLKGVLSPSERTLFEATNNKKDFLGGRFAAKEAFLKAIGTGLSGGPRMKEIDVKYRPSGQPVLCYDGKEYEVSISHDGDYAFAVVIIP